MECLLGWQTSCSDPDGHPPIFSKTWHNWHPMLVLVNLSGTTFSVTEGFHDSILYDQNFRSEVLFTTTEASMELCVVHSGNEGFLHKLECRRLEVSRVGCLICATYREVYAFWLYPPIWSRLLWRPLSLEASMVTFLRKKPSCKRPRWQVQQCSAARDRAQEWRKKGDHHHETGDSWKGLEYLHSSPYSTL